MQKTCNFTKFYNTMSKQIANIFKSKRILDKFFKFTWVLCTKLSFWIGFALVIENLTILVLFILDFTRMYKIVHNTTFIFHFLIVPFQFLDTKSQSWLRKVCTQLCESLNNMKPNEIWHSHCTSNLVYTISFYKLIGMIQDLSNLILALDWPCNI